MFTATSTYDLQAAKEYRAEQIQAAEDHRLARQARRVSRRSYAPPAYVHTRAGAAFLGLSVFANKPAKPVY